MKLTILGKYGPFPKAEGGTSSYLLEGENTKILFDVGTGSLSSLEKYEKVEDLDGIILSHSHYDHVSDLGVYHYRYENLSRSGKAFKKPVVAFYNDGSPSLYIAETSPYFDREQLEDGKKLLLGEFEIEVFEMKHPVKSFGFKLTDGKKTFAYTGDTNVCVNLEKLAFGVDALLADGAFLYKDWAENKPHLSAKHVCEIALKIGCKAIISHLIPNYNEEEYLSEIKSCGVESNVFLAAEGKTYTI